MKKLTLLLMFFSTLTASAQYADLGTGTFKNELYWFDWAGFTIANNATRTFNTADGLTITITFSNVSPTVPSPNIMNTWRGAVLHFLYDFSNTAIRPAFYSINTPNSHQFTMHITATRGGTAAPFMFVAADAEASNYQEVTTLSTTGSVWQTMEFFRNNPFSTNNPVTGCGTTNISISETYGGSSGIGQNPIMITGSPLSGVLDVTVGINRINASGGLGVAFALFAPIDRGDLSASYGDVHHRLNYVQNNPCNYLPPYPTMSLQTNLAIGTIAGDADPVQTTDDNLTGIDEDGIANFPAYTGGGTYSVPVNITNTTGNTAYLTGWFDYNHDGQFSTNESTTLPVTGTSLATLTWTGLPATLPRGTGQAFRFRLSTNQVATQSATQFAPDGEVEDYWLPCSHTINTSGDTTLCAGQPIPITTTGGLTYTWNIAAGLSDPSIANPVAIPTSTTKYIVEGNNYWGCYAKDSILITINPNPVLTIGPAAIICSQDSTQLSVATATAGVTYHWSPATGLNDAGINNPKASPATDTKYIVTVNDAGNGCTSKDSITVAVLTRPAVRVRNDTAVCNQSPVTLTITATAAATYSWSPATGLSDPSLPTPVATPSTDTRYVVTAQSAGGCVAKDSIDISVLALPVLAKSADTTICRTGTASLSVSGAAHYNWLPAVTTVSASGNQVTVSPAAATKYYVTATGSNGCTRRDSILIGVRPLPQFALQPASAISCQGMPVLLTASGGDTYAWLHNNSVWAATPSVTVQPATHTMYKVGITDKICNYSDTLSVLVRTSDLPTARVTAGNSINCSNDRARLQIISNRPDDTYAWDPAPGITELHSATPTVMPEQTTKYYMTITNKDGCSKRDSVEVLVDFAYAKSTFSMANVFTPNGDGQNDCFGLKYWGVVKQLDFTIYNRWGGMVFRTSNPNDCWDGRFQGKEQSSATFVYQIKAVTACGTVYRKGTVTLIR